MITKAEIVASGLGLSKNAPDTKINTYIKNQLTKLRALLPVALYAAIEAEYIKARTDWSITQEYAINDLVMQDEAGIRKVWKALTVNTGNQPDSTDTTNWLEIEVGTFLIGYVHPYLAGSVFLDYAVLGGVNVSHQGLQQIENETATPVTGNKLQAFLNHHRSEREILRVLMLKYLDDQSYVLDGTTYDQVKGKRKRRRSSIRAVGYSGPVKSTNSSTSTS